MNGREEELSREEAAREQFIVDQFERVGLNIRDYPELFERFKRLHNPPESKHFEDASQIADIIETIWNGLETELPFKLEKEQMLLAALLHDVGKSGPKEATPAEQELIIALFDPTHYERIATAGINVGNETILRALRESNFGDDIQRKIAKYLNRLGVNIASEKMIDFWRRHADWTYDILKTTQDDKIDERLAVMAASHHILDGKKLANLKPEDIPSEAKTIEIVESYEVLTVVDKFQAFMRRGDKSHSEAIKELQKKVEESEISEDAKKDYFKIIAVIANSADKLQAKLKT